MRPPLSLSKEKRYVVQTRKEGRGKETFWGRRKEKREATRRGKVLGMFWRTGRKKFEGRKKKKTGGGTQPKKKALGFKVRRPFR